MPADFEGGERTQRKKVAENLIEYMRYKIDQDAYRLVLSDGTVITKCDRCREMYRERIPPQEPPCTNCHVELMPENADAIQVYEFTKLQTVTTEINDKRYIDINIIAVKDAMEIFEVKNKKRCLIDVKRLFYEFLELGDES